MKVGLVQINNTFSGANYFPYSVGMLQSYAEKHLSNPAGYEFLLPVYRKILVDEAVQKLMQADLVAFSVYVWNMQRSLAIAKELKRRKPDCIIVFGGPHVPNPLEEISHEHGIRMHKKIQMVGELPEENRVGEFFSRYPFIDITVHGEGELAFTSLLENLAWGMLEEVPSISYRSKDGTVRRNARASRIQNLSDIPSPYLEGIFDRLIEECGNEHQWLGLWETNRGCPFSCGYCDWGSATADKVFKFDLPRLYSELEWFAKQKVEFIFCCDANFGLFERDVDIAKKAAAIKNQYTYPKALSVQNAKNSEERIFVAQKTLADAGLNKGVTLAFESLHPATLDAIKRKNIRLQDFKNLQTRFMVAGIQTYCDFIIAMPMETYDSFADGISQTIHMGQHNRIQFGNLSILPNTEMAHPAYQKKYGMKTQKVKSVIYHGIIGSEKDETYEVDELVIATSTMPEEAWVKTRAFAWMSAFLHFDKVFQIPLILAHELSGVSYRDLIEIFLQDVPQRLFPRVWEIRNFFFEKARQIQAGGEEYCPSPEWLNVWWPADEYMFIKLCRDGGLAGFYKEAEAVLRQALWQKNAFIPDVIIGEAVILNRELIKLPFQLEDKSIKLSYTVLELYQAVLHGKEISLEKRQSTYHIDRTSESWDSWEEWYRQVVWYGNKKGAYLYGNIREQQERAGHY